MLATSLISGIRKRGGTAELKLRENLNARYAASENAAHYEVVGTLNGMDVHAYCQADYETGKQSFGSYTVRAISRRGEYNHFSDYNPHGLTFLDKVKDLDWACRAKSAS